MTNGGRNERNGGQKRGEAEAEGEQGQEDEAGESHGETLEETGRRRKPAGLFP